MIGVIIATHNGLSESFVKTTNMFIDQPENLSFIELHPSQNLDEYSGILEKVYNDSNSGKGVLFLTDLFGGTPSNKVYELMFAYNDIECVTGVNLGMIMEVLFLSKDNDISLSELATRAANIGKSSIVKLER